MNILAMILVLTVSLFASQPDTSIEYAMPNEGDPSAFLMLSRVQQRHLEKVSVHYWIDSNEWIWTSQAYDDGAGKSVRTMSDETLSARNRAYRSFDAPLWYCLDHDLRMTSKDGVIRAVNEAISQIIFAQRREYLESINAISHDQFHVVSVLQGGKGLIGYFIDQGVRSDTLTRLDNHPMQSFVVDNEVVSIDYPAEPSSRYRWSGSLIRVWSVDESVDLNAMFPLAGRNDYELVQLMPEELAEEMYARGMHELPIWKMEKYLIAKGRPQRSHNTPSRFKGNAKRKEIVDKGTESTYGFRYVMTTKKFYFKRDR